jgi:hypothetical protein
MEGRGTDSSNSSSVDGDKYLPFSCNSSTAVFQIVQLYPECFGYHTSWNFPFKFTRCRFGGLLCDTERGSGGIRQRTYSLWDYLDDHDLRGRITPTRRVSC